MGKSMRGGRRLFAFGIVAVIEESKIVRSCKNCECACTKGNLERRPTARPQGGALKRGTGSGKLLNSGPLVVRDRN